MNAKKDKLDAEIKIASSKVRNRENHVSEEDNLILKRELECTLEELSNIKALHSSDKRSVS